MFRIDYYRPIDGRIPVKEFIDSLEHSIRSKVFGCISILAEMGNSLSMSLSRSMGDGIFELRVQFSNDATRIFYFFFSDRRIILTNGYIKKTDRTPSEQLAKARRYKRDFEGRNK